VVVGSLPLSIGFWFSTIIFLLSFISPIRAYCLFRYP